MLLQRIYLFKTIPFYLIGEEEKEETKDAVADEPIVEDAPQEKEDAFEDEQEDTNDEEESDEETPEEDEAENEDEESQDVQEQDPTYKPKLVSSKKIYVFKNKNVGQCKTTRRNLRCFSRKRCIKRHSYYKKRCVRYLITRYCVFQYTTTCKFCTRWFFRRCYRLRRGYKYYVKCYNSRHYQSCVRRVTKRYNRTLVVKKTIVNVKKY